MTGPVAFLDLDRTTIYSAAALALPHADHDAPRLLCVEIYQGLPLSFMTEAAVAAFHGLLEVSTVVPTTTRTVEQADDYHGTRVADPYRWLEEERSPAARRSTTTASGPPSCATTTSSPSTS